MSVSFTLKVLNRVDLCVAARQA